MQKLLIFFTAEFPYGKGEVFIEHEFPYLAQGFDLVYVVSNSMPTESSRPVAPNVAVNHFPYHLSTPEKILALQGLFAKEVWEEVHIIRKKYGLGMSRGIWNTLLLSWYKAEKVARYLHAIAAVYPDHHITVYGYWSNDMALGIARFKQQYPGCKAVARGHGWDIYQERSAFGYLPLRKYLLQNLDCLYPIGEHGKQYLFSKHGAIGRVSLARLGTPRLLGQAVAKPKNREFQLVSCSSVIALKRVHLIAEALALLTNQAMTIRWKHVGGGPLFEELQQKISALGLKHVTLAGFQPNADLLEYYRSTPPDLFINVSETEGVPVSIMEAFSAGIPVVATEVGGTGELVSGQNGFLLPPNPTPAQIAAQIAFFAGLDAAAMQRYREAAFQTWEEKCAAERVFPAFVEELVGWG